MRWRRCVGLSLYIYTYKLISVRLCFSLGPALCRFVLPALGFGGCSSDTDVHAGAPWPMRIWICWLVNNVLGFWPGNKLPLKVKGSRGPPEDDVMLMWTQFIEITREGSALFQHRLIYLPLKKMRHLSCSHSPWPYGIPRGKYVPAHGKIKEGGHYDNFNVFSWSVKCDPNLHQDIVCD